jgi:hypothetical protein
MEGTTLIQLTNTVLLICQSKSEHRFVLYRIVESQRREIIYEKDGGGNVKSSFLLQVKIDGLLQ